MDWWEVLIIIVFIFVGFYVAGVCVYAFKMGEYDKRIAKNLEAIDVLIVQKYDLLRRISKIFVALEIKVPKEFILDVRPKFEETLKDINIQERAVVKAFLMRTAQALFYYGETNPELAKNADYLAIKENYSEIDHQYRITINLYNADVIGYNYWTRLFWFRWVAIVRKMKQKDIIS